MGINCNLLPILSLAGDVQGYPLANSAVVTYLVFPNTGNFLKKYNCVIKIKEKKKEENILV